MPLARYLKSLRNSQGVNGTHMNQNQGSDGSPLIRDCASTAGDMGLSPARKEDPHAVQARPKSLIKSESNQGDMVLGNLDPLIPRPMSNYAAHGGH